MSSSVTVSDSSVTLCTGPTRRFRRVCEKLQVAIVNPSYVNPLTADFLDYGCVSSDDTLVAHTSTPVPGEGPPPQADTNGTTTLLLGDSTDECESDGSIHKPQ